MVGLKVSLAIELRYECKVHNGIVPSAQPATSRSAAGTLEGKGLFQDHRRSHFGLRLKHPPYEEMGKLGRKLAQMDMLHGCAAHIYRYIHTYIYVILYFLILY